MPRLSAVGIPGMNAGEDVKGHTNFWVENVRQFWPSTTGKSCSG